MLFDEIQNVHSWEKAVNGLLVEYEVDITITGSNAFLLSSELSTLLSGCYVEIKVYPFSLKEYMLLYQIEREEAYRNYLRYGGLPILKNVNSDEETMHMVLQDIFQSVMMKDILQKNVVKDAVLLENIVRFIFDNIGNITSTKRISDILNSQGRKTTNETVDSYLKMLAQAFIIYKVSRYDVKGMQYLKSLEKYYVVDCGLRNAILGYRDRDYGRVLENIVFLELRRRGYEVSVGKLYTLEIDFIAKNRQELLYIQVAQSIAQEEVMDRELKPLLMIKDNHRKMMICSDTYLLGSEKGVEIKNIIDFLLEDN